MGCRSFLHHWEDPETGEEVWDGRNNLGVVSVNLPQIALTAGTQEDFWSRLESRLETCKEALLYRINRLRGVKAKVAPILYCEGALGIRLDPEDEIIKIFENGRASISLGYIGIHEMVNAMFPDTDHIYDCPEKQKFAKDVVQTLRAAVDRWKLETGWAFGLYGTPSENLCDRFCRIDTEKYGVIPGVTDREYYTNSFHLDVEKHVSPMDKIKFESAYHKWSSSGNISYVEVPNISMEMREIYIETVWDYASKYLPYFGTNCVIDFCHECMTGGDAKATEDGFACEHCGNTAQETLEVTKRVCGYLGSPNARPYNHGKQMEVIGRVKHKEI